MANGKVQKYADTVNLQLAAEAFLKNAKSPASIPGTVAEGNTNNSKKPAVISELFGTRPGARYELVAHQDLTQNEGLTIPGVTNKSGFSNGAGLAAPHEILPRRYPVNTVGVVA